MLSRFFRLLWHYRNPLILFLLTFFIGVANYEPGTWLTGWDTLHPEFDFGLNFARVFNGVWREEQGLGAVAAHAHMSELPRLIVLWILSLIFPLSALRYVYMFICLSTGTIGMYFFLSDALRRNQTHDINIDQTSAFLGGLFYLCNLAVLHMFLVPFEMFPTQYALLPWLFLFATQYLLAQKRKTVLWFTVATFFSMPMAYAFQLWYVFAGSFFLYLLGLLICHRSYKTLKRTMVLIMITLSINAFWLLPHVYFLSDTASHVPEAHANMLFSQRMFELNKARSSLWDVAVLQGALYDWSKFDGQRFVPLFSIWKTHLDRPIIILLSVLSVVMMIMGLIRLVYRRTDVGYALLPAGICCFLFMASASWPFELVFEWLREQAPLLKEGLRSPYTKCSIVLLFTYSFLFAYAQPVLLESIQKKKRILYTFFTSVLLIIYLFPFFTGNLIDISMKVKIPQAYQELFTWFKTKPAQERVALLPVHSFWGWEYYKWGYQGAGFIWFGLPQSILVRDFDRWQPNNENFYWEFSYAVYSRKSERMKEVLQKYRVKWLIVDNTIISPSSPQSLYFSEIKELIHEMRSHIQLAKTIDELEVYKVDISPADTEKATIIKNVKTVSPSYKWNNYDRAYHEQGDYISSDDVSFHSADVIYPFLSLFTGRASQKPILHIRRENDVYFLQSQVPWPPVKNKSTFYYLESDNTGTLQTVNSEFDMYGRSVQTELIPLEGYLTARIPILSEYYTYDTLEDSSLYSLSETRCDTNLKGPIERYPISGGGIRFVSQNASNCMDILLTRLDQRYSYMVEIESDNKHGSPFLFSIQNIDSKKSEADTYLPLGKVTSYFIIPPMKEYGRQYALHFDNLSIGNEKSINDLLRVRVQRFPYDFLHSLKVKNREPITNKKNVFILSQSYDYGWLAFDIMCVRENFFCTIKKSFPFFFGTRIKDHVKVNNWANGWVINSLNAEMEKNIIVIFWPQYLQYVGLLTLLFTIFLVVRKSMRAK